jgi:hypothetical protein
MRGSLASVMERYLGEAEKAPKPQARLSARILCREGLVTLRGLRSDKPSKAAWPVHAEPFKVPIKGLYGVFIFIPPKELLGRLCDFTDAHLRPAMDAWVQDFHDVELGDQFLQLPAGMADAANERHDGIAMRCIIAGDYPIGDRDVPSHWAKYYDVAQDKFEEGYCSTVVSFWVHTPDTAANLLKDA